MRHLEWNDVLSEERQHWFQIVLPQPNVCNRRSDERYKPRPRGRAVKEVCWHDGLSIAHRLELRKFHANELKIKGDGKGGYEVSKLK